MKIEGLIFDMDGTITVPAINFKIIREELGVEEGEDILKVANRLPLEEKQDFLSIIEKYELEASSKIELQKDVKKVLNIFSQNNIKLAILTRNSDKSVLKVLNKLNVKFDIVLTREFEYYKPAPEPVNHILKHWNISKENAMIIGDFLDDILCGKNAGIYTCFFENKDKKSYAEYADYSVKSFLELKKLIIG